MTLVNGGPDLNFIEHIPATKWYLDDGPSLASTLSSLSQVSLYHCSGTTSYNFNFRLQQHESEELGLLPARKYEYLVLAFGILLVCPPDWRMLKVQHYKKQLVFIFWIQTSYWLTCSVQSWPPENDFPTQGLFRFLPVTFDTKRWRQGSAIHPMRRVQNSPLHCAPSTPVDAEKIVEQPWCRSYLTPVWSVFVSLSKVVGDSRWVLTQSCNNCIKGIQKMKVQVPFVETVNIPYETRGRDPYHALPTRCVPWSSICCSRIQCNTTKCIVFTNVSCLYTKKSTGIIYNMCIIKFVKYISIPVHIIYIISTV